MIKIIESKKIAEGLMSVVYEIVPEKRKPDNAKKQKRLCEVLAMEEKLALQLMESITKKCFQKFVLRPESQIVSNALRKKFEEEVVCAIAEVFAIVPDGYKKLGK